MGEYNPCKQYGELISYYVDGELKPKETRKVVLHLKECSSCSEVYNDFLKISQMEKEIFQSRIERFRELRNKKLSPELNESIAKQNKSGKLCMLDALEEMVTQTGFDCIVIDENNILGVYGRTFIKGEEEFRVLYLVKGGEKPAALGPIYSLNRKRTKTIPACVTAKAQQLDERVKDYFAKQKK